MTPDELADELSGGTLRSAYLLAGSEALLRDDALAALRQAALGDGPSDFDLDVLDGERASPGTLLDALATLPVLAPRRLVVLREPAGRRAGGKGLPDALTEALASLDPDATCVLVATCEKADRRARWVKAFVAAGAVVECEAPRRARELAGFIRAEAARRDVVLGPGAAELLAERVGPQLLVLRQEIAKAALWVAPGETVDREQVAASASDLGEEPVWDLTDAIGEGRARDALGVLHGILSRGAPPPVVLGALASHVRKLTRIAHGGRVAGPPFVTRKLESQARRYRPARLVGCLRAIHDADEVLKGRGGLAPEATLERLVLALAG